MKQTNPFHFCLCSSAIFGLFEFYLHTKWRDAGRAIGIEKVLNDNRNDILGPNLDARGSQPPNIFGSFLYRNIWFMMESGFVAILLLNFLSLLFFCCWFVPIDNSPYCACITFSNFILKWSDVSVLLEPCCGIENLHSPTFACQTFERVTTNNINCSVLECYF